MTDGCQLGLKLLFCKLVPPAGPARCIPAACSLHHIPTAGFAPQGRPDDVWERYGQILINYKRFAFGKLEEIKGICLL